MSKPFIIVKILLLHLVSGILSDDQRLPTFITPSHYSLDLKLDPTSSNYSGYVQVKFSSSNAVLSYIRLHASPETIKIQSVLLNYLFTCDVDVDETTEIITLGCPFNSVWAENTVIMKFEGTFGDTNGLYKSSYIDDGKENILLTTKFEAVAARRAFPCFDEPSLKATFDVFITHPDEYIALANTPVKKQFLVSPGYIQTQFETTPPMSTYLLGFMVSKFVSNDINSTRAYDDQVYSRNTVKDFTTMAAKYGPLLVDLLSNWTGIDYEDLGDTQAYQVLIPHYEGVDMESWGLNTFREQELLDEKNITSALAKQRIITGLARELSLQWFGDYVTLDWWSQIWLKEGLATYFQYYIPDQLDENLDVMMQFTVNELQTILQIDADPSALPLTSNVDNAEEYEAQFNDISYSKGGSVIRMLRNILGETIFRDGIQSYLTTYKYNNTDSSSLFGSFTSETPLDVDKIMENWIYKAGFPLVTAKLNGSTVILTQERFTFPNASNVEETEWYIPISYTTSDEKNFNVNIRAWLDPTRNSTLEIEAGEKWIIFNLQQIGYYRVNYDDTLWRRIIAALINNHKDVDVLNRAQLIDDVFSIARTGRTSYEIAFLLAEYLKSETEYYPWVSAFNALSYVLGKLGDDEAKYLLKTKVLFWINKAFPQITKSYKDHVDTLKEVLVLKWACRLGQNDCITYAKKSFESFKSKNSLPDYNKRGVVFCYGFHNSTDAQNNYDFLFNLFKNSVSILEKMDVLSSLGCTEDTNLLSKYLSETISEKSTISNKDATVVFEAVYTNVNAGVDVVLKFLGNNLENVASRYNGTKTLSNLVLELANKVVSEEQINRLTRVIDDNLHLDEIKNIRDKVMKIIATNQNWSDAYSDEIKKILQNSPNKAELPSKIYLLFIIISTVSFTKIFNLEYN